MKRNLEKIILIVVLLLLVNSTFKGWAQSNPTTTGPIGSQLAYGVNEDIKFWNGTEWVSIPSGLPGQSLTFNNGIPSWIYNPNGITTNVVTNIGGSSAISGGYIASSSGSPITVRGICWSTNHNPSLANNFTTDDIGKGNYISNLTGLINNTKYYIRAYATNSKGTAYGNELSFTTVIYPVIDFDGNGYDTVTIGTQTWLKQNLKATHYRNGGAIPNVIDGVTWSGLTTGAYCNYNNDTNISNTYGRLYNWYTVNDSRMLCPTSWHIPTNAEWTTLTSYLGGEGIAGGKLKEVGLTHWQSPNTGATNETGFTALSVGCRDYDGSYYDFGIYGFWWSSTMDIAPYALGRYVFYNSSVANSYLNSKKLGFSVRCMKD